MERMSPLFLAFILGTSSPAAPAAYKVSVEYERDGHLVMAPRFVVQDEKPAEIRERIPGTEEENYVAVTAKTRKGPAPKAAVLLQFELGKIVNGKKVALGKPQISALEGEPASISMGIDGKEPELAIHTKVEKAE